MSSNFFFREINRFKTQNVTANDGDKVLIWGDLWDPSFWYTIPTKYQHKVYFLIDVIQFKGRVLVEISTDVLDV